MLGLDAFRAPGLEEQAQSLVLERLDHDGSVARCATLSSRITPVIIGAVCGTEACEKMAAGHSQAGVQQNASLLI